MNTSLALRGQADGSMRSRDTREGMWWHEEPDYVRFHWRGLIRVALLRSAAFRPERGRHTDETIDPLVALIRLALPPERRRWAVIGPPLAPERVRWLHHLRPTSPPRLLCTWQFAAVDPCGTLA